MLIFFIIGLGRSGQTSWGRKFGFVVEQNNYHASVDKIIKRVKKAKSIGQKVYGEVSHFHLRMIPELKKAFPNAFFIHNVRNGKDMVTSWYYIEKVKSPAWLGLDKIIEGFNEMDKFEKICWMWKYWNEKADEEIPTMVRIEDFEHLLTHENRDSKLKSIMKHDTLWTKWQKETFERICGDLHRKYGYDKRHSYG